MKKIYSAFVSSAFTSLRDERSQVIDVLLDFNILPIGMEHFTVSTNGNFSDIQEYIDDSDFFIMLLGDRYGSCDENGVSWTEREYWYALQKSKPIIVILCDELIAILDKDTATLTEDQKKQLAFRGRINGYTRMVSEDFDITKILTQFLTGDVFSRCTGWSRVENLNDSELAEWRNSHRAFDLSGIWHHVHLSEDDDSYIRIGSITIEQDFHPNTYKTLKMTGENYNASYYDSQAAILRENKMKSSSFTGEYTLKENGEIFGIFKARRSFNGAFNLLEVNKGERRGIHDFKVDISVADRETTFFDGEFHDEAPSPKQGRIFLFRDINERNAFLLENRETIIEVR